MATITNNESRLIWGPRIKGHKPAQWLPGKNRLDPAYWREASKHPAVKRWLSLGWLEVDEDEDLPDPTIPPSDEELAEFSERELGAALRNPNVPVQWHPALEAELERRKTKAVEKKLPPKTPPTDENRKSLSGLRVDEALPLIEAETDADTLEAWADADKRKTIEEAIDRRLTELASED